MTNKKQSTVRIIAGKWRSRKIAFPNLNSTRPTTDRLRETAFNWLSHYLEKATCLDAFAGSGILGFEALSRGAKHVTFIDQRKTNTEAIIQNASMLNTQSHIDVCCTNFFSFESNRPFDIIFLDPPYHQHLLIKALNLLKTQSWVNENTIVYIEGEKEIVNQLPNSLTLLKQKSTQHILIALTKIATTLQE